MPSEQADAVRNRSATPRKRSTFLGLRELTLIPVIILVIIIGAFASDAFLTTDNFLNILQQSSELSVVVIAETLILLAGKFDLSLELVVGLAPMLGAWLIIKDVQTGGSGVGLQWWLAIPVVLATGALVGLVNGFLIVKLRLNAFIVTLAMLILLRGVQLGTTNGKTLFDLPDGYLYLGSGKWAGIPVSIWIAGILYLVFGLFLRYHRLGRALYAIGGNADAARVAGIRVERVLWGTLIVGGMLAALAGSDADRTHRLGGDQPRPEHDLLCVRGGGDRRHQPERRQGAAARRADRRTAAGHPAERADAGGNPGVLDRCRLRRDHPGGIGARPRDRRGNGGSVVNLVVE